MQPREQARIIRPRRRLSTDPDERERHDFVGAPLIRAELYEVVIVAIESSREARRRVHRVAANERAGGVASSVKCFGKHRRARVEAKAIVRSYAV